MQPLIPWHDPRLGLAPLGRLSAHGAASVLVIHTHLGLKILHRQGKPAPVPLTAYIPAVLQLIAALAILTAALPLVFSAGVAIFELTRLPKTLDEPLMRVGFRALGVSITHTLLAVYILWTLAHQNTMAISSSVETGTTGLRIDSLLRWRDDGKT